MPAGIADVPGLGEHASSPLSIDVTLDNIERKTSTSKLCNFDIEVVTLISKL